MKRSQSIRPLPDDEPAVQPVPEMNVPVQPHEETLQDIVKGVIEDFKAGRNIEPMDDIREALATWRHFRHKRFNRAFSLLPAGIQALAVTAFKQMKLNPASVDLKRLVRFGEDIYSAEVGRGYRAMAVRVGGSFVWYWIGTHEEYNNLVAKKQIPTLDMPKQLTRGQPAIPAKQPSR